MMRTKVITKKGMRGLWVGLLALSMLLVMLSVNSSTVYAVGFSKIEMSNPQYYPSGCLKSLDVVVQADGIYSDAYGKIGIHTAESDFTYYDPYTEKGDKWPETINDPTLVGLSSNEFLWSDAEEHKTTVVFEDGVISCDEDMTYVVHLWTRAPAFGVYTDARFADLVFTSSGKMYYNEEEIVADDTPDAASDTDETGNGYVLIRDVEMGDMPYTWNIPTTMGSWNAIADETGKYETTLTFGFGVAEGEKYIILEPGKKLSMTIQSGNGWELTGAQSNKKLAYEAYFTTDGELQGDALANGAEICSVTTAEDGGQEGKDTPLMFRTVDAASVADVYNDTLIFTATIADEAQ